MLKSLWKDPVWSAVIAAAVVAAAGAVGTYLLDLWPAMAAAAGRAWQFLFATTEVSNWILILLGLGLIPAVLLVAVVIWDFVSRKPTMAPSWTNYKEDVFFGLKWRWQYVGGRIDRLVSFCPHCDYQVYSHNASGFHAVDRIGFDCDSCRRHLCQIDESQRSLESKVERFIQQKLRNETWRQNGDA